MDVNKIEKRMCRDRMLLKRLKEDYCREKMDVDKLEKRIWTDGMLLKRLKEDYSDEEMDVDKLEKRIWRDRILMSRLKEDYSNEEIDVDELERKMWRDKMLFRRLKEQSKGNQGVDYENQRQTQRQAWRKKMSRAQMMLDQGLYNCEYSQCLYHDYFGFPDRTSRNNHQMNCAYGSNLSQAFGLPSFQINNDKPATPQQMNQSSHFDVSDLDIPEDGMKKISDLLSFYDTLVQQRNKTLNPENIPVPTNMENHIQPQQKYQFQMDDIFFVPGVVGGNMSEHANISSQRVVFPSTEVQFDHCKVFDSPLDNNPNDNIADSRFDSPANMLPVKFPVDTLPKQDDSL
ncbi:protein ETHYLENE INSENSITIVE 3-like [Humulus lupulus]|uniref:protein ETHYLENE INSENSITIVE 3-like n=1 Tax=Humulus lupulus TaxID=3486 RepID=UPI002B40D27C|nr:protein ETHYLENE INSENSITIVE 3-like [Humulus lupulus]